MAYFIKTNGDINFQCNVVENAHLCTPNGDIKVQGNVAKNKIVFDVLFTNISCGENFRNCLERFHEMIILNRNWSLFRYLPKCVILGHRAQMV